MKIEIWIAIGIVFVVVWAIIIWEIYTSPITPDDYNKEPKKKRKRSHGLLGGNLDDVHMREDNYIFPQKLRDHNIKDK